MGFTERINIMLDDFGGEAEFGRVTGLKQQTINKMKGGTGSKVSTVEMMCKKTGTSANWLILGIGPKKISECATTMNGNGNVQKIHINNGLTPRSIQDIIEWVCSTGSKKDETGIAIKIMIEQHFPLFALWIDKKKEVSGL